MTQTTPSGPALIRDRRCQRTYLASTVQLGDQTVTFTGGLRTLSLAGEIVRPARRRTLPLRDVAITWLDEPARIAA